MSYVKRLWYESWKETWELTVESPWIATVIAVAVVALSIYFTYLWREWKDVTDILADTGIGFLSLVIVFAVVFLFHFLFLSPRRLYLSEKSQKEKAWADIKLISDAQKAIPQLAGFWFTKFGGNVTITQEGIRIKSSFPHGSVDHFSEGVYDPVTRKIEMKTERVDIALPLANQRYVYPETWEYISDDRILYNCPRNFNGEHEIGILWRRTHE